MSLFKAFCIAKTTDILSYFLGFDLSIRIYTDLEELHPTDSAEGIFCEHARDQSFQERRKGSWKMKLFAI